MKIAFDSCVFINLFALCAKLEKHCAQNNKSLQDCSSFDLQNFVKQDMKRNEIYLNILKGLKSGMLDVWILPTVFGECIDGPNKNKIHEFETFLKNFNIKKAVFCQKQVEFCEFVKNKYISGEGAKAVVVDEKNSKHPHNDSQILAEALVTECRLVTADEHFSRTQIIFDRNKKIVQNFNLPEELAKILPLQVNQFAKTRLYKSLSKEKSISC